VLRLLGIDPNRHPLQLWVFYLLDVQRHHAKLLPEQLLRLVIYSSASIYVDEFLEFRVVGVLVQIRKRAPEDERLLLLRLGLLPQEAARKLLLRDGDEKLLQKRLGARVAQSKFPLRPHLLRCLTKGDLQLLKGRPPRGALVFKKALAALEHKDRPRQAVWAAVTPLVEAVVRERTGWDVDVGVKLEALF